MTLTMMCKCYNVSSIEKNHESVSRSCIAFRHGIVAKLTSKGGIVHRIRFSLVINRLVQSVYCKQHNHSIIAQAH